MKETLFELIIIGIMAGILVGGSIWFFARLWFMINS
jgi:formate/nitrite transporter FocA (FNT family)